MSRFLAALLSLTMMSAPLAAQEAGTGRVYLGFGHVLTNDLIGDGEDRWRTGSYQASWLWGPEWGGTLPGRFGSLIELRFGGEIVSPENVSRVVPGDRPFGGVLSLGLHTHFALGSVENSVGVDIAVTGPQTGLDEFQSFVHNRFDGQNMSSGVRDAQIEDDVYPTLVLESGRSFELSPSVRVRPFFEGRVGLESLARAGADFTFGQVGRDGLMVREPVAGQRYDTVQDGFQGVAFVLGGDVAYVHDSELLPGNRGVTPEDYRTRLRSGIHWQTERGVSGFYGLTWLGKEFTTQDESQLVGSLRLKLNF